MGVQWTTEQKSAIEAAGSDLLLSAAAGSGKTAVLVERILTRIMDPADPVDIDRLLVVTFTNAAAAQMRERIGAALEARLEEEPDNVHLQRQVTLIHHAQIMTIHSFCLQVIRSHSSLAPLDPDFRIPDEGERSLLCRDVAGQVIEEAYGRAEPDFLELAEMFAEGRTEDQRLEEILLAVYGFSMGSPRPAAWRRHCVRLYEEAGEKDPETLPWLRELCGRLRLRILDITEEARRVLSLAMEQDGPYYYASAARSDLQLLEALAGCSSYGEYAGIFAQGPSFETLGRGKDTGVSKEKKARAKAIRDGVKKELQNLKKKYFDGDPEESLRDLARAAVPVRALMDLADRFQEAFDKKKREKNLADFNDLEHFALDILVEEGEDGPVPTAAALAYRQYFEEVMIDEYQDSNLVQELLLSAVSREGKDADRFMVGDVKQSIYRFRLARPELFLEKYRAYREEGTGRCIHLRRNFRSRPEVLDGVNLVFGKIMTPALGGIAYDEDAALYPGAEYPEPEDPSAVLPEVLLIAADGSDGCGEEPGYDGEYGAEDDAREQDEEGDGADEEPSGSLDLKRAEAACAARQIKALVGSLPVFDRKTGTTRPARYGDVAVLLRSVTDWAQPFTEVFVQEQIPVYTGSGAGYFSATEIRTILSFLQVLDNPRQDIPLAASLRSPIGGLSDAELALVRCAGSPEDDFYTCCERCVEQSGDGPAAKLASFRDRVRRMRDLVPYTPMHRLLWIIFEETGYLEYASALPGGTVRRANLEMLAQMAAQFEAGSYSGLYQFVRYIELLKKYEVDYGEASSAEDAGDTVRLMSIHKSKGLEFPIVLVCGLGKSFNRKDAQGTIVMHHELGIGLDLKDPALRLKVPLLSRKIIGGRILDESLGEELRVLYVAMTRAKEKLILTGTVKDAAKKLEKWKEQADREGPLSYSALSGAGTFLDWLMPAVLSGCGGEERIFTLRVEDAAGPAEELQEELQETDGLRARFLAMDPDECDDPEAAAALGHVLSLTMPHAEAAQIPGKVSVSDLKHAAIEEIAKEEGAQILFQDPVPVPLVPRFIAEARRQSGDDGGAAGAVSSAADAASGGAARGTAMHRIMELLDFSAPYTEDFLDSQLESLQRCGKIQKDVLDLIDTGKIRAFLASPLADRMRAAAADGRLFREQPFTLGIPASRIRPEWPEDEEVLVQGIIDAYLIEEGGIVLLDYKTDRIGQGEEEILAKRYRVQLECYREALERMTGLPVKEKLLYSFRLGKQVAV